MFLITTYSEKAIYVLGNKDNADLTAKEVAEKVLELVKEEENLSDEELKNIAL